MNYNGRNVNAFYGKKIWKYSKTWKQQQQVDTERGFRTK